VPLGRRMRCLGRVLVVERVDEEEIETHSSGSTSGSEWSERSES